jgi:hypothetical protein
MMLYGSVNATPLRRMAFVGSEPSSRSASSLSFLVAERGDGEAAGGATLNDDASEEKVGDAISNNELSFMTEFL